MCINIYVIDVFMKTFENTPVEETDTQLKTHEVWVVERKSIRNGGERGPQGSRGASAPIVVELECAVRAKISSFVQNLVAAFVSVKTVAG